MSQTRLQYSKSLFQKASVKIIKYRDQRHFDQKSFFMIWIVNYYKEIFTEIAMSHKKLSEIFVDILNDHAPLKEKPIRGNHAPFTNKELSKAIMEKSKTRNKY